MRRAWRRLRPPPRAGTAAVLAAAVVVPLVVAAVAGRGNPVESLQQSSGSAWVVSPAEGLLSLIDGPSEEVMASVRLGSVGGPYRVEQAGSSAYVADAAAGTVARVDGATGELSDLVQFAEAGSDVSVLHGGDTVFVLDPTGRAATRIDPETLQVRATLSTAATPGPDQAVVDDAGRLWLVDAEGGGLTWFDTEKHVDLDAVDGRTRLVVVQGRPVLVDLAAARIRALDDRGRPGAESCLDVRRDDTLHLLGSQTDAEVFAAVSQTGNVLVATVGRDDCDRVIPVSDAPEPDFGPLAQSGRFVFVPDRATGTTTVIDTRTDTVAATFTLAEPGHQVELVAKDGLVFYNDLDGATAGVLTLDAGAWRQSEALSKYDPSTGEPATVITPDDAPDAPVTGPAPAGPQPAQPAPSAPSASGAPAPPSTASPPPARGAPQASTAPSTADPSPPPPQPDLPPVIGSLSVEPNPPTLGAPATFGAAVSNVEDATWSWTLSESAGPVVTTSSSVGGFTATLPSAGSVNLLLSLTITGPGGTATAPPLAFTAVDPDAVAITSVTTDAPSYAPGSVATVTAALAGGSPGATWAWSATVDGSGVAVPGATGVGSVSLPVGTAGTWTVTVEVTSGARSASGSVSFVVGFPCNATSVTAGPLDLLSGPREVVFTVPSGCVGESHVDLDVAPWLSASPASLSLGAGQTAAVLVSVVGQPAVDGLNANAVFAFLDGGSGPGWDVVANRAPVLGATSCNVIAGWDGPAFFASFADADGDSLDVTLTINGSTYDVGIISPGTWRYVVSFANVGTATTWVYVARDSGGATTTFNGVNAGCW